VRGFLIVCITSLIALPLFGQQFDDQILRHLRPLKSSRADVLQVAKKVGEYGIYERYETAQSLLDVLYSDGECVGHGWKVGAGTVVQFNVYPKKEVILEDTDLRSNKDYVVTLDDTLTSYYSNKKLGLRVAVEHGGAIRHIDHRPTALDWALRCRGFPEYDPSSETYSPTNRYVLLGDWSKWLYGALGGDLKKVGDEDRFSASVFIYSKDSDSADALRLKSSIEDYAYHRLKLPQKRVKVDYGGIREREEVEVFIVPDTYPPPVSRPLFPLK